MTKTPLSPITRRQFTRLGAIAGGTLLAAPAIAQSAVTAETQDFDAAPAPATVTRNISGMITREWQPFFSNLNRGAMLIDTESRVLHWWPEGNGDGYKIYPTSVPKNDELTRRGRTEVIQKVVGPSWSPTPNMLKRNPDLPRYVGPGPINPLGTHALYLSWTYYRVHGTNDTRKIGRKSSNGCIGLYNEDIQELFGYAQVGTQVMLI